MVLAGFGPPPLAGAEAGPASEFGPSGAWKEIARTQLERPLPSLKVLFRLRKASVR